jgi:hypothetical protein
MLNRLNELSFVIGAFFTLVSLILFGNILVTPVPDNLSIYSAIGFLVFGLLMMLPHRKKK